MDKIIRLFFFGLLVQAYSGYCQAKPSMKIFVLDKNIRPNVGVSELSIKKFSGIDSLSIDDTMLMENFIHLLADSNSYKLRSDIKSLDVRMLIELNLQGKETRVSLSNFNIISVNGFYFESDVSNLIKVLKRHIPPDLNWYEASKEEIAKYKRERFNKLINNVPDSSKGKKKKQKPPS